MCHDLLRLSLCSGDLFLLSPESELFFFATENSGRQALTSETSEWPIGVDRCCQMFLLPVIGAGALVVSPWICDGEIIFDQLVCVIND